MRLHNERSAVTGSDINSNVIVEVDKYGERVMRKGFGASSLKKSRKERQKRKYLCFLYSRNLFPILKLSHAILEEKKIGYFASIGGPAEYNAYTIVGKMILFTSSRQSPLVVFFFCLAYARQ